jgi:flagellar motor component MotA
VQIISKNDTIRSNNRITAQVGASLPFQGIIGAIVGELGQIEGLWSNLGQFFLGRGQKTIFSELLKMS